MKKRYTGFVIVWGLLCVSHPYANAQEIAKGRANALRPLNNELFPINQRYAPVLDSSINVAGLSLLERNELINKLFEVDQMYRIQLHESVLVPGSAEEKHLWKLIVANDPVNQAILLKILKLDGWPCDLEKGEKSLSYRAWFIAWHNRNSYEGLNRFFSYIKKAKKINCINTSQFNEVDELITRMRKIRNIAPPTD